MLLRHKIQKPISFQYANAGPGNTAWRKGFKTPAHTDTRRTAVYLLQFIDLFLPIRSVQWRRLRLFKQREEERDIDGNTVTGSEFCMEAKPKRRSLKTNEQTHFGINEI